MPRRIAALSKYRQFLAAIAIRGEGTGVPSLRELARDTIATTKSSIRERRPFLEYASSTTVGALLDLIEEFEQRVDDATPREIRDYAIELEQLSSMLTAEVWRAQR